MQSNYKQDIISLSKLPSNSNCFDCNLNNPEWISINNGIFLCLTCAGYHRNLGLIISKIKSILLDTWSLKEYNLLKNSGNQRLKLFMKKYDIDLNEKIEIKYKHKIIQYYRDLIKAENDNLNLPEELSKEEAKQLIKDNIKSEEQIKNINNEHIISNGTSIPFVKKKNGIFQKVKNFFKNDSKKPQETNKKQKKLYNNNNYKNIKNEYNSHYKDNKSFIYEYNINNYFYQNALGGNLLTQNQMNIHKYLAESKYDDS